MNLRILFVLGLAAACRSVQGQTYAQLAAANDLTVLNYALTLENLESAFYNQGLAALNASQFNASGYDSTVYSYLQMVQAHEASHVTFLTNVINSASSGAAVPPCTYTFTNALQSPANFITTAAALENAGQTAYDGAINGLTNAAYAQAAAQIATVEARHAAYLNQLLNPAVSPFPQAFDTANLPSFIANAVAPFIVSCPYNITLPSVRPSGVKLDGNNQVVATGILSPSYTATQQSNDITALNYALTLENFEAAFYNYSLTHFSEANFTAAGLPASYYNISLIIGGHEAMHVSALIATINGRVPNAAVPPCVYNFTSVSDVNTYLAVARLLEQTGVEAYDGAVNTITDTALQQVAATIATVEARHAAFLNQLNNMSPFPNNTDSAKSPADIINAVLATGLVVSCPYTISYPVVVPVLDSNSAASISPMLIQLFTFVLAVSLAMAC